MDEPQENEHDGSELLFTDLIGISRDGWEMEAIG